MICDLLSVNSYLLSVICYLLSVKISNHLQLPLFLPLLLLLLLFSASGSDRVQNSSQFSHTFEIACFTLLKMDQTKALANKSSKVSEQYL